MKKLKIYSTLLAVALGLWFLLTTLSFSFRSESKRDEHLQLLPLPEEYYSVERTEGGSTVTHFTPTLSFSVHVRPKVHFVNDTVLMTTDISKAGLTRSSIVEMEKVSLKRTIQGWGYLKGLWLFTIVELLLGIVLFTWIIVLTFKIVRRLRKGEVFIIQVSQYLHRTGWMLVSYYVLAFIYSYAGYLYLSKRVFLAQYEIVPHCDTNVLVLILGFVLLIISQVILMGKDLKEEQELTI